MSEYPKTSIIDIAMGVLNNMNPKTDVISENTSPKIKNQLSDGFVTGEAPDVSDTTVTDDYITNILEGSMGVTVERKKKVVIKEQNKTQPKPTKINEGKITDLITRLSSLLAEAKQMLSEMTTVGMIGTNLSGKGSKKK